MNTALIRAAIPIARFSTTRIMTSECNATASDPVFIKKPKKNTACVIGYCGSGYSGLQINDNANTIELELFNALCKAGAIGSYNADDPRKCLKSRAARTDKGVHAALNVVTFKLIDLGRNAEDKVNSFLPESIRLWKLIKTTGGFNPRTNCDSRIYEYLIPTYCFAPPSKSTFLGESVISNFRPIEQLLEDCDIESRSLFLEETEEIEKWESLSTCTDTNGQDDHSRLDADTLAIPTQRIQNLQTKYRLSSRKLQLLKTIANKYVGLHNFHNYTLRKSYHDPSAMRRIFSIDISDPFMINSTEWVSLKIHGQSFMLHQIRKIVSMIMLVVRCSTPINIISESFLESKLSIPKAPGLGLLLERPVFSSYTKRAKEYKREPIEAEFDSLEDKIKEFKSAKIYPHIYLEAETSNMYHMYNNFVDTRLTVLAQFLTDQGLLDHADENTLIEFTKFEALVDKTV